MTRKSLGSVTFGTSIMRTDEVVLMASVMTENGESLESSMIQIEAMDDLLSAHRLASVSKALAYTKNGNFRKGVGFHAILEKRVNQLVDDLSQSKPTVNQK